LGANEVIAAAPGYSINHLELSQEIVSDLRDLRDPPRLARVTALMAKAHGEGIPEVVIWDHPLYDLNYYPDRFRTGPGRTLNLDDPAFWAWFKADYAKMLDLVPDADGLVVTFFGTAGHAELQSSTVLPAAAARLAAVVNAVADVVVGTRHLNLYVRVFPNDRPVDPELLGAVALIARPEVRLMIKPFPLDYFLTAPDDASIGALPHPTVAEYELTGEFNGEGLVPNTFVEDLLARCRDINRRPNVIGYTIRTDRLGESRLVGRPGEINLWTVKRAAEDPDVTADQIYDEFITAKYGAPAVPEVKAAMKNAFDVVTSGYYTLGTPLSDHSKLDYDLFAGPYLHFVTARWLPSPIGYVRHGLNREFHYWRDVVNHLAPPAFKDPALSSPYHPSADERRWLAPGEAMNEEFLRYIVTEKSYGVGLAEDSLRHIKAASAALTPAAYGQLRPYFERAVLTARLQRAAASAYFGLRVWNRGPTYRTAFVNDTVQDGMTEIREVCPLIRSYPVKPPTAQYVWAADADLAERYFKMAAEAFPYVDQLAAPVIVAPRVLVDNPRVRIQRWLLAPGEGTPVLADADDHVDVVIQGSSVRSVDAQGLATTVEETVGETLLVPKGGRTHSFANAGTTPFEMVSVDLKGCPPEKAAPPAPLPPSLSRLVSDRVVPSDVLVDDERIKLARWRFRPGECSPIHTHFLDHVYIVVRGSKVREITGEGKVNDDLQESGRAAFSPARGKIHSFGNIGDHPYEMVSLELKSRASAGSEPGP
jgi:mannose-6-phosphate isomerase-like protein (cupin superfamily)